MSDSTNPPAPEAACRPPTPPGSPIEVMPLTIKQPGEDLTEDASEEMKVVKGNSQLMELVDDSVPRVGMIFQTADDAYHFYLKYAFRIGFGITKKKTALTEDRKMERMYIHCAKWGKGKDTPRYKARVTARTDCAAFIKVSLFQDGLYHITAAKLEHNHACSPSMTCFFRCYKSSANAVKKLPEYIEDVGVELSRSFQVVATQLEGTQDCTFDEKDCRNHVKKYRDSKLRKGDAQALHRYFAHMQSKNSNFFYLVEFDDENRWMNVFWADASSRAAYQYFGDVVAFDTTYINRKYDVPFAPFVGVNHHGQSVLLGCGLISSETTRSYIWLFKAWLQCMYGKPPNAIITDQCQAIATAVAEVFPKARQRMCIWHIMRKLAEKFGTNAEYEGIRCSFKNTVYESLKADEFEENWRKMIDKYSLQNNMWLTSLYKNRHEWVPVYLKDTFWAGLRSTQRNESMNTFFDGYVNPRTSLKHFLATYEAALESKYEKESRADFESFNKERRKVTMFHMEEQLSNLYTIGIFEKFQKELMGLVYCNVSVVDQNESIFTCMVTENVFVDGDINLGFKDYEVIYNKAEDVVHCICCSWEVRGILCKHALSALIKHGVQELPSRYILCRWRKDFKRLHVLACRPQDVQASSKIKRFDIISTRCLQLAEVGSESNETYVATMKFIKQMEDHLLNMNSHGESEANSLNFNVSSTHDSAVDFNQRNLNENEDSTIFTSSLEAHEKYDLIDPPKMKRKRGRPRKRKETKVEQNTKKLEQKILKEKREIELKKQEHVNPTHPESEPPRIEEQTNGISTNICLESHQSTHVSLEPPRFSNTNPVNSLSSGTWMLSDHSWPTFPGQNIQGVVPSSEQPTQVSQVSQSGWSGGADGTS